MTAAERWESVTGISWDEAQQRVIGCHSGPKLCINVSLYTNSMSKLYKTLYSCHEQGYQNNFLYQATNMFISAITLVFEHGLLERLTHFWRLKWPFEEVQFLEILCWLNFSISNCHHVIQCSQDLKRLISSFLFRHLHNILLSYNIMLFKHCAHLSSC